MNQNLRILHIQTRHAMVIPHSVIGIYIQTYKKQQHFLQAQLTDVFFQSCDLPVIHVFFVKESLNRLFVVLLFLQSRSSFVYYDTIWTVQMRHLAPILKTIVTNTSSLPSQNVANVTGRCWKILQLPGAPCGDSGMMVWVNNCDTPQKTFQKETQYCQFTGTMNILHNFAMLHPISDSIRVFNLDPNSGDTASSTGVLVVPRGFIPYIHHGDSGGFLMWGDGTNCI